MDLRRIFISIKMDENGQMVRSFHLLGEVNLKLLNLFELLFEDLINSQVVDLKPLKLYDGGFKLVIRWI